MGAADFMKYISQRLNEADELVGRRKYAEAYVLYERLAGLLRAFRDAQRVAVPGQTVPLALRLMIANRDLIVPLDRLGELATKMGQYRASVTYFREVVEAMEEATSLAGLETKTEFAGLLANAKGKLAEAEAKLGSDTRPPVDIARYDARHRQVMSQITAMDRVPGEATLLLARRILQRPMCEVPDDELRRAVVQANQLPNYTAPLTEPDIDALVESCGAHMRSLALDLAAVYRSHPGLL